MIHRCKRCGIDLSQVPATTMVAGAFCDDCTYIKVMGEIPLGDMVPYDQMVPWQSKREEAA